MASGDGKDERRVYYDHEPAYRRLKDAGAVGWESSSGCSAPHDAYHELRRFIGSDLFPDSVGSALELGCGGGQGSLLLAEAGWEVFSTDYSRTAVGFALENARRVSARMHVFVSDGTRPLPVQPGRFGLVIELHVLHCIVDREDRRQFLRNAFDALAAGGVFFGHNMTAEGFVDYDRFDVDRDTRIARNGTRFFATKSELVDGLVDAGFEDVVVDIVKAPPEEGSGDEGVIFARKGV